jgi:hypothetical protein
VVGVVGGIFLTTGFDADGASESQPSTVPVATFAPMRGANGDLIPAFAAMGSF